MAKHRHHPDIARVLISETRLHKRISELACQVGQRYLNTEVSIVGVLNGSMVFLGELLRQLPFPTRLDSIVASSYKSRTVSSGRVKVLRDLRLPLRGRDVLLVDDILDTGRTLSVIHNHILSQKPASLRTCVLLDKPTRRVKPVKADFVGFVIGDDFVVGYGLDYAEQYRNLPYIGILKPSFYR